MTVEVTTLGGGCFWCVEAVFDDLQGVQSVESGYMGGQMRNPSYRDICTGMTGHAEVVQVTFDPAVISYADMLRVFLTVHDPTTLNRQGADVGTQYRSVIFTHSPEQEQSARAVIAELSAAHVWPDPIVTEVTPASTFYVAEEYHQEYFRNNPNQGYCQIVIAPKVAKFRRQYTARLKAATAQLLNGVAKTPGRRGTQRIAKNTYVHPLLRPGSKSGPFLLYTSVSAFPQFLYRP